MKRLCRVLVAAYVLTMVICAAAAAQMADPLKAIPRWVDLPEAPFVAKIMDGKAVLVNRGNKVFDTVFDGCVIEQQGRTRVGYLSGRVSATRIRSRPAS
jgi:hypothetical protein